MRQRLVIPEAWEQFGKDWLELESHDAYVKKLTRTEPEVTATLDEICVVALAEAFRGDGEVLCNPMGPVPVIAGRLARASFEPDLMLTDTIAYAIEGNLALGGDPSTAVIEAYMPFRSVFDQAWSGKRHVVMGASPDRSAR